jgi:FKBP-type peptidyl-prolyl cis-trans isomerase SlpA
VINTFNDKPATLSLGTGELSPAMEQRLLGLAEGTRTSFELPGRRGLWRAQPRHAAVGGPQAAERAGRPRRAVHVGDVVQFPTPDGQGSYAGAVQQVREDGAVLFDFNHPLAGQPVTFEVQLIGVL